MTATEIQPGQRRRMDFQSDIFERPYVAVEPVAGKPGVWLCANAEPTDAELDQMLVVAETGGKYVDVAEVEALIAEIGETFEVRFVTHAQWAEAF